MQQYFVALNNELKKKQIVLGKFINDLSWLIVLQFLLFKIIMFVDRFFKRLVTEVIIKFLTVCPKLIFFFYLFMFFKFKNKKKCLKLWIIKVSI